MFIDKINVNKVMKLKVYFYFQHFKKLFFSFKRFIFMSNTNFPYFTNTKSCFQCHNGLI